MLLNVDDRPSSSRRSGLKILTFKTRKQSWDVFCHACLRLNSQLSHPNTPLFLLLCCVSRLVLSTFILFPFAGNFLSNSCSSMVHSYSANVLIRCSIPYYIVAEYTCRCNDLAPYSLVLFTLLLFYGDQGSRRYKGQAGDHTIVVLWAQTIYDRKQNIM